MTTWFIVNMERYTDTGGVWNVHYRCEAVDGDYSASSYGTCGFTPDATDPAYIPFESLTESDVLSWVYAAVDKDAVEAGLTANIEDQKAPKTEAGLPW